MNKTVTIGEWADALRSGKYTQGSGQLKSSVGHCCLGVLCDLIDPSAWHGSAWSEPSEPDKSSGGEIVEYMPPDSITKQTMALTEGTDTVQGMNDEGATFTQIADEIEHRLPRNYAITIWKES